MKQRLTFIILGILAVGCVAFAADLGVSESLIDFGTVKEGPPVIKTVTLTNNGTQPITIAKATAS
jgi:uncharacterized protein YcfJ